MSKARKPTLRPGRGTKGEQNPLLSQADQGKAYIVKSFIIQPEITLLDPAGKEERKFLGPQFAVFEAQLEDTLLKFMERRGVKLKSGN